ncbi:MAG: YggL family protein [Odoribacteraceae bacterium]|jgi:hypothetical protein|nr:YggL family protein [Odoribacteraceae bacterium]
MKRFLNHLKNEANPKRRISRGKLFVFFFTAIVCLLSCEKNGDANVKTALSEEEITTFYTRIENFVETPDFKSHDSTEELKPLVESWLKQQPEVASVKIEGDILTFALLNGGITEIEFTEPEEMAPEEPLDFDWETVDGSYFTGIDSRGMDPQKQPITESQSATRAETTNYPDYIYPVFWEPTLDISLKKYVEKCFDKSVCRQENTLTAQDTFCRPSLLPTYLNPPGANPKPNLIFIATHGSPEYLQIGSHANLPAYQESLKQLNKGYGIDISKGTTKVQLSKSKNKQGVVIRYIMNLHVDDLAKLLKNVDFSNSIVFLNACNSLSTSAFADVFLKRVKRGAAYVYGFVGKPYQWPILMESLLNCLISPNRMDNAAYVATKTTGQAISYVRGNTYISEIGLLQGTGGDPDFRFQHPVAVSVHPYSRGNAVTTRSSQEPAVAMGGCHINYYSPGAGYSQSFYGIVYSKETDNPRIGDGKSNYKFEGLDHEVFGGEDFYLSLDDIEYDTQYHYRAFVCSIYSDGQAYIYYSEEVEPFEVEGEEEPPVPPPANTPPHFVSDQTWVIAGLTWSDRVVGAPVGCVYTDTLSRILGTSPPAQYKVYDGRYYYNWTCVDAYSTQLCPSPWRVPSPLDFSNFDFTVIPTLVSEWGYGGFAYGDMRSVDTCGSYWTSLGCSGDYDHYGPGSYYAYNMYYQSDRRGVSHTLKVIGGQVRCVK